MKPTPGKLALVIAFLALATVKVERMQPPRYMVAGYQIHWRSDYLPSFSTFEAGLYHYWLSFSSQRNGKGLHLSFGKRTDNGRFWLCFQAGGKVWMVIDHRD